MHDVFTRTSHSRKIVSQRRYRMPQTMPLKDTAKLGSIARKADPEDGPAQAAGFREVQWERYVATNPDAPARVERVSGFLPWTHASEAVAI
jgi:hypothetical protein